LGFELSQGLHLEPLHQPYFFEGFFEIGAHWTICSGWLWTMILLISASWVARITGLSHWHLAGYTFLCAFYLLHSLEKDIYAPSSKRWQELLSINNLYKWSLYWLPHENI
jgi:hypothetical protein